MNKDCAVDRAFELAGSGLCRSVSEITRRLPVDPVQDLIAFTADIGGDYEIWSINADGAGLKRLTTSPGNDPHNSWSPDGKWTAFASARGGFKDEALLHPANPQPYGEIHVMRADGSEAHPLTDEPYEKGTPTWRPVSPGR